MSFISAKSTIVFFSSVACALGGCSSQGDTNYRGEPLAVVSGTVETGSVAAPSSLSAGIAWAQPKLLFGSSGTQVTDVGYLGETTPVAGSFPAGFTLDVFTPAPAASDIACADSSTNVSVGFIVALDHLSSDGQVQPSDVVGAASEYLLIYQDTDEPDGWSCLPDMGFTYKPTKGYHLMQGVPNSEQPRAYGAVYPAYNEAPNGLSTSITVTLGQVLPFTPSN